MKLTTKQWNWILLIIFLINTILILVCVYQVKLEKDNCIDAPLIYGAKKLTEANKAEFSCTCTLMSNKPNFVSPIVTFDQYGLNVEHVTRESKSYEYNFSKVEEMFEFG